MLKVQSMVKRLLGLAAANQTGTDAQVNSASADFARC